MATESKEKLPVSRQRKQFGRARVPISDMTTADIDDRRKKFCSEILADLMGDMFNPVGKLRADLMEVDKQIKSSKSCFSSFVSFDAAMRAMFADWKVEYGELVSLCHVYANRATIRVLDCVMPV